MVAKGENIIARCAEMAYQKKNDITMNLTRGVQENANMTERIRSAT